MENEIVEQRTDAWKQKRIGKVTASRIKDVLSGHDTAAYQNYLYQIALEQFDGKSHEDTYQNEEMERGIALEPFARVEYEQSRDVIVDQTDFIDHPTIKNSGCSPDGLVTTDGLIEIKCRNERLHIKYLLSGEIPKKDRDQMLWQLACYPAREWNDLVAYNPAVPAKMQTVAIRLKRDTVRILELEKAVTAFLLEVEEIVIKLKKISEDIL